MAAILHDVLVVYNDILSLIRQLHGTAVDTSPLPKVRLRLIDLVVLYAAIEIQLFK